MLKRAHLGPLQRLARSASPVQTNVTKPPAKFRPASGQLPDAGTLIRHSHDEQLTGHALARVYGTSAASLYRALEGAGRSREELWTRPPAKRTTYLETPEWAALVRDYVAGDAPLALADRYGVPQQTIARRLDTDSSIQVRDRAAGVALRTRQAAEADAVRYRLRTGALANAAADLGVTPAALHAALDAHGLLLHDLPEPDVSKRTPVTPCSDPGDAG
ncbi:hypothetical protein [Streptomyces nigrescens]|uniref:hypothetical protein n=1 Tax=Streptomyces nigrescens TaxID=1920 RepID=UPI0036FFC626